MKYNRGSLSSTVMAAKHVAKTEKRTKYVHSTAYGYTITNDDQSARMTSNYLEIKSDGTIWEHERDIETRVWSYHQYN